jgi:hypothetical protein
LAASSASSTYVKYASSPPPCRLDIIYDLEMVYFIKAHAGLPKKKWRRELWQATCTSTPLSGFWKCAIVNP